MSKPLGQTLKTFNILFLQDIKGSSLNYVYFTSVSSPLPASTARQELYLGKVTEMTQDSRRDGADEIQ